MPFYNGHSMITEVLPAFLYYFKRWEDLLNQYCLQACVSNLKNNTQ